jgi:hypothetical protein
MGALCAADKPDSYNGGMQIYPRRSALTLAWTARRVSLLALAAVSSLAGTVQAQTAPNTTPAPRASGGVVLRPAAAPEPVGAAPSPSGDLNQAIERVRVEGEGVTVNELRVGGETRSISVQPKGNFPAYSVQPRTGERNWKLFDF